MKVKGTIWSSCCPYGQTCLPVRSMEAVKVNPLLSTCCSLNKSIHQKWPDKKKTKQSPPKKVGILNFFVSMRISVGWLFVLITGDFLVPLLDICWTKWRKCGLGCIFDVNIHRVFRCVCTSCLIHARLKGVIGLRANELPW